MCKTELRSYINCMRKGLCICPTSIKLYKFHSRDIFGNLLSCCPRAHAVLGFFGKDIRPDGNVFERVEPTFLHTQKVLRFGYNVSANGNDPLFSHQEFTLAEAINELSGRYKWMTEQVIEWLESHLDD